MNRTISLIDGFNLYHSLRETGRGSDYRSERQNGSISLISVNRICVLSVPVEKAMIHHFKSRIHLSEKFSQGDKTGSAICRTFDCLATGMALLPSLSDILRISGSMISLFFVSYAIIYPNCTGCRRNRVRFRCRQISIKIIDDPDRSDYEQNDN